MFLIKLLAVYLPFEAFFLKWLPISEHDYSLLRQLPDAFVFGLMGACLLGKFSTGKGIPLIGGKVDIFLFFFVIWTFITLLLNPAADSIVGIANIKALLRYVLLIYIILMLNPSQPQVQSLITWLSVVIGIQVVIGLSQFVGGISVRDYLAARHVSEGFGGFSKSFTGDKFEGINDLMGTMGDTISFAYFLMMGLTLWLFSIQRNGVKFWGVVVILLALIYLSGSRAATVASLLLVFGYVAWLEGWKNSIAWFCSLVPIVVIGGIIIISSGIAGGDGDRHSFWFIFSGDYIQSALNQRLGVIVYLVPNIIFTAHNVVGFSPDKYFFAEFVAMNLPSVPHILVTVLPNVLEDVYWVAMYVYYGLIGFLCWVLFLFTLYKRLKNSVNLQASLLIDIGFVAKSLILISIPLNFLNQAFEVRAFSFYLWLFCGLALIQRRQALRTGKFLK